MSVMVWVFATELRMTMTQQLNGVWSVFREAAILKSKSISILETYINLRNNTKQVFDIIWNTAVK